MRINVYTEELIPTGSEQLLAEIVTADYVSSRTGLPMTNYGLRVYLKSAPELHYIPGRDDDRSAVTIWCGAERKKVFEFWDTIGKHTLKEFHPWRPVPNTAGSLNYATPDNSQKPKSEPQPKFTPGISYAGSGLLIDMNGDAWWVDSESRTLRLALVGGRDDH